MNSKSTSAYCFCALVVLTVSALPAWTQEGNRLLNVIENIKAKEELFKNIEVIWRRNYKGERVKGARPGTVKTSERKYRCVLQEKLMYVRWEETLTTIENESASRHSLSGYDGTFTRMIEADLANVIKGRREFPHIFHPHTWMLTRQHFPLSLWLTGGKHLQAHPYAGLYQTLIVKVTLESEETVDNLHCLKLRHETFNATSPPSPNGVRFVWLASERNYLPVKTERYVPNYSKQIPLEVATAGDFREIGPGIWLPFRFSMTIFAELEARAGKQVVSNVTECIMEKAALDPNYDIGLFRDIPLPPGTVVYDVTDDKITDGYQVPPDDTSYWWAWLLIIIGLLGGIGFVVNRFRSISASKLSA